MKNNFTFISFLFLFFVGVGMSAQAQNVESQLKNFDKQADATTANQFFDELLKAEFLDEKVVFGQDTPTDSLRQQVWWWAAEWLYAEQKFKDAEKYALQSLPLFAEGSLGKANCLNTLGCIYVRLGDFQKAADCAKQSVDIEVKGGDHDRISSSMNTLAGIYMAAHQAKDAEKYILQALEHAEKADNPGRKAILLGMASEIYHSLSDDKKALSYAEQAYEIEEQLGREPKKMIRLSQKAAALIGLHRYKEAEEALRICIPALKEMGNHHSMAIDLNKLGMSLLGQKRPQEAIPYYKEAAEMFSKMGDLYNEIHSNRGLYESYWTINPDSAKFYLDRADLLKDSLYSHSTAEALSRYNAEFGNDQLQLENERERASHRRSILIAAILILLLAAVAWYMVKSVQRRHQQHARKLIREIEQLRKSLSEKPAEKPTEKPAETPKPTEISTELPQSQEVTEEESPTEALSLPDDDRLFLMRVIDVVNAALPTGEYGVKQISFEMNMSESTFRRRLMETAGETPKSFTLAIQMEKAAELLKDNPEMSVQDVAYKCGFEYTSSFGRIFKQNYGCSPSQYRNQQIS